jgi:hypothetical protein
MYFPYLRCKQFELLALRELASKLGKSGVISPVLEPVKKSTTSLDKALESLIANNVNFTIILNPIHGEFTADDTALIDMINNKLEEYDNFQFGILVNQFLNLDEIEQLLDRINFERPIALIHLHRVNDLDALAEWAKTKQIKYNLFGENIPVRRYRGIITATSKVILEDKFNPQIKNSDYLSIPEEFFSDEYLYFEEDGNVGFGDYLTVGNDYNETGFLPYAVAIHLTYVKENEEIWIGHFVSDSNADTTDVAGKFGEALEKLIEFIDAEDIHTEAAEEFREHHRNSHYPGLGSLKKLSIKHHLELIIDLLG